VWQTLRNTTGQTLSSRTLLGRFLFEEVELLQVLMEPLSPGSAFVEQSWLLQKHMPNLLDFRRRGDHEAFEAEPVNRRRQAVSARTLPNLTRNLQMPKGNRRSAFDIIVGITNDKEDQPNVHLELT
jgi:hypothetical protein